MFFKNVSECPRVLITQVITDLLNEIIVVERAKAVATHKGELMGIQPTGRKVTWTELHAYRVQNGQITEVWSEADFMGIMVQLGVVTLPGG